MATVTVVPVPSDQAVSVPGTNYADNADSGQVLPPEPANNIPVFPSVEISIELLEEAPSARPPQILFGALRHPNLRLRKSIPLRAEKDSGTVSVVWEDIQEFGYGDTLSDALYDFAETVTELFIRLSDEGSSLSGDLLTVRGKLTEYIEFRPR